MQIPHHAHVLVIDGRKLLFLRNEGSLLAPKLTVARHKEHESAATHDQGTDRPGQTQSSVGAVRSGYSETDFHQMDEDRFAVEAAAMLQREIQGGHIESLIVVAAPKTLGVLRKHFTPEVAKRITGEIAKDLAGRPVDEIAAAIANAE